jgi:hypothetical protein
MIIGQLPRTTGHHGRRTNDAGALQQLAAGNQV